MSEILSAIKLKDRIIIVSVLLAFAVVLALVIGAITGATVDPHVHSFKYHIERGEDGSFDYVGVCTDSECESPVSVWDITNAEESVISEIKVAPTCTADGVMKYSFRPVGSQVTYTYEEKIPALSDSYSHTYYAEDATVKDGVSSVTFKCENEACNDEETIEISISDMTFVELVEDATCNAPKVERYSYTYKGVEVIVTTKTDVEDVPHKLNGVFVTELMDENGYLPYNTEGVNLDVVGYFPCGSVGNARFVCEVCEKENKIKVIRDDHKYEFLADKTSLPTDKNEGKAYLKCTEEDCGQLKIITLPVVVATNDNVISRDQDKEEQTVKYTYVSGDYGFVIEEEITIPWNNHRFEFTEDCVVRPTFDKEGEVTLTCKNSSCSKIISISLPKIITEGEDKNTTITYEHLLEKKVYTYLYSLAEYGIEVTFSLESEWIDHNYVYAESETVLPDLEKDGVAYVRCDFEGCPKHHVITLPKIVLDENATMVSPASEQAAAIYRYLFENSEYGINIKIDFNVGEPLSHDYKYDIVLNVLTGKFDFVGKCNQLGCEQPEIREESIEVEMEDHSATCTTDGILIIRYFKDGVEYKKTMPNGTKMGHNYVESDKIDPTFARDGSVNLVCSNEGCGESIPLILPQMDFRENIEIIADVTELSAAIAKYTYVNEEYNYTLIIEFTIGSPLKHEYTYTIQPNEETGGYDLVGVCNQPECQAPTVREENIDAIIEEHISDCTTDGYIYVKYEKDGITYELTLPTQAQSGHKYEVDVPVSKSNPTWEKEGSAVVKCVNEGCDHTVTVVLPIIDYGVTAFYLDDNQLYYMYTDPETRYEHFFLL